MLNVVETKIIFQGGGLEVNICFHLKQQSQIPLQSSSHIQYCLKWPTLHRLKIIQLKNNERFNMFKLLQLWIWLADKDKNHSNSVHSVLKYYNVIYLTTLLSCKYYCGISIIRDLLTPKSYMTLVKYLMGSTQ